MGTVSSLLACKSQTASGMRGVAPARGDLLPCPGVPGLGWLGHLLVLPVPPLSCKGLPFSLPSLHPYLPGQL